MLARLVESLPMYYLDVQLRQALAGGSPWRGRLRQEMMINHHILSKSKVNFIARPWIGTATPRRGPTGKPYHQIWFTTSD